MLRTRFCERFGIEAPIAVAPMGPDLTGPELVAAVCEAGGFGILQAQLCPPPMLRQQIRHLRTLTSRTGARRSTAAPPAIPVTPSAAGGVSVSRRSSGGPRRRPDCARPVIAGWHASGGSLPSPPPPTTWCVCPSYWAWRHSHARIVLQYRAPDQTPVREAFQCSSLYNHSMSLCYVV